MKQYLDYEQLQYYHQKLTLDFSSAVALDVDIDNVWKGVYGTPANGSFSIPGNGYLRIKLGGIYSCSGIDINAPIEWTRTNLDIQSNTEYAFADIIDTKRTYTYAYNPSWSDMLAIITSTNYELDGLSIELLCEDENDELQYYSTIGSYSSYAQFVNSKYEAWSGGMYDYYNQVSRLNNSEFWNFIEFDIPVGSAQTFNLNYHTDSSNISNYKPVNRELGTLYTENSYQVTLIHTRYDHYSLIFYWRYCE